MGYRVLDVRAVHEPLGTHEERSGWNLDVHSWLLTAPNGRSVDLSSAEYQILLSLLEVPGQTCSREDLNERLGKPHLGPDNRSLDVLVSRLRRKAENETSLPFPLRAARGAGYVFAGEGRVCA